LLIGILTSTNTKQMENPKPFPNLETVTVGVIGLGYVGLPLAVEIARSRNTRFRPKVIGFDINENRLIQLRAGNDITGEVCSSLLKAIDDINYTSDRLLLEECRVFIVTVPTPVNNVKQPDLTSIKLATNSIAEAMKRRGNNADEAFIIIYESTVYPGVTEEICVPILERVSNLKYNIDFFCGYSPERINPGDKLHTLSNIIKVTSGSNYESADWIDKFYASFILAGTHRAPSIKIAEAAKVIENTQRDLNIALINELSILFNKMGINIHEVLDAASTKWNFLNFKPGLVGGHCIGVDPYYLTYKAEEIGYHPQLILAGRRINDGMAEWIVTKVVEGALKKGLKVDDYEVLVLGFTFKENCPDIRNTKVLDVVNKLVDYGFRIDIVDCCMDPKEGLDSYSLKVTRAPIPGKRYGIILLLVAHEGFMTYDEEEWQNLCEPNAIIFDFKNIVPESLSPVRI